MKNIISLALLALVSSALAEPFLCPQDAVVNTGMKNKKFTDGIVMCLMDEKPCKGKIEKNIKAIAPGVFRGACVPPCTPCMQKQARKAILFMQKNYPRQFGQMVYRHGRK